MWWPRCAHMLLGGKPPSDRLGGRLVILMVRFCTLCCSSSLAQLCATSVVGCELWRGRPQVEMVPFVFWGRFTHILNIHMPLGTLLVAQTVLLRGSSGFQTGPSAVQSWASRHTHDLLLGHLLGGPGLPMGLLLQLVLCRWLAALVYTSWLLRPRQMPCARSRGSQMDLQIRFPASPICKSICKSGSPQVQFANRFANSCFLLFQEVENM